jgi:membrane protein implicated in regulation of membrane protease activity
MSKREPKPDLWLAVTLLFAMLGGSLFMFFIFSSESAFVTPDASTLSWVTTLFILFVIVAMVVRSAYRKVQLSATNESLASKTKDRA